jgi:uncharacterized membrane protein (DUF485 family)
MKKEFQETQPSEKTGEPAGINGWPLVLFCYLTVQSIVYAVKLSIPLYVSLTVPRLDFLPQLPNQDFQLVEMIANLFMLAAILLCMVAFLARRKSFPTICVCVLFALFILSPAMFLYHQTALGLPVVAARLSRAFISLPNIENIAAFIAASWYLSRSRRVANAFVR